MLHRNLCIQLQVGLSALGAANRLPPAAVACICGYFQDQPDIDALVEASSPQSFPALVRHLAGKMDAPELLSLGAYVAQLVGNAFAPSMVAGAGEPGCPPYKFRAVCGCIEFLLHRTLVL